MLKVFIRTFKSDLTSEAVKVGLKMLSFKTKVIKVTLNARPPGPT